LSQLFAFVAIAENSFSVIDLISSPSTGKDKGRGDFDF
jgi:hypothetical protein